VTQVVGNLLGIKAPQVVQAPVNPIDDPAAKAAAEETALKQRQAALLAGGRASTILTGGTGDTSAAQIAVHKLLGQ
jgi:hypothetical protein